MDSGMVSTRTSPSSPKRLLFLGAEARITKTIFDETPAVQKERLPKPYRHPVLDAKIRRLRTSAETKQLLRAHTAGIRVPAVKKIDVERGVFWMEFIDGPRLTDVLAHPPRNWAAQLGKMIAKLHQEGIVHGDLTTSNVMVHEKELVLLDFGLSFNSSRMEDFGVDLLNLKKTLLASHPEKKKDWAKLIWAYAKAFAKGEHVLRQLEKVEGRARYR